MKTVIIGTTLLKALLLSLTLQACTPSRESETSAGRPGGEVQPETPGKPDEPSHPAPGRISITAGQTRFTALLNDNATAAAFGAQLPLTVTMGELNGNEKYHYLSQGLPPAPVSPGAVAAGDLMLFGTDCLVLFYKSFATSYSYTPIGRLSDATGLGEALGSGSVTVTFEPLTDL